MYLKEIINVFLYGFRRVTTNFLGQECFLGIRALLQTIIINTKNEDPAEKNLQFFLLKTLKNYTETFNQ